MDLQWRSYFEEIGGSDLIKNFKKEYVKIKKREQRRTEDDLIRGTYGLDIHKTSLKIRIVGLLKEYVLFLSDLLTLFL